MARYVKFWFLVALLPSLVSSNEALPRKRVCVIGAGMAGVAAIKQLSDLVDEFEPIAFDKKSDIGGLWIYTNETELDKHGLSVHSRVYKNMRTSSKELLTYPEYRQFIGRENRSHVSPEMVAEYIRNYTNQFDLRRYIQLDTLVKKISPIKGNDDWRTTKWRVETRNFNTNEDEDIICDAIMVCNGHYFKPNVPKIDGIESFPGRVLHSSAYRIPESFASQTVVVLGSGISGIDISLELSSHAKTVYLSHRHDKIPMKLPSNLVQVKGIVAVNGSRFTLQDNTSIKADSFIYCTGYLYDYPFLDESSGIYLEKGNVRRLYKIMINVEHPSMAFVGLPNMVVNTVLHSAQSKYFVALLRGKVQLPSYEDMKNSEIPLKAMRLHSEQWKYMDDLAIEAGFEKVPLFYQRGYKLEGEIFQHFVDSKDDFDLCVIGDNEVITIRRRDGKTGTQWQDFID